MINPKPLFLFLSLRYNPTEQGIIRGTVNKLDLKPLSADDFKEFEEYTIDFCAKNTKELLERELSKLNDKKIGLGLSGGTDSSLLVALLFKMRLQGNVKSYCVGFGDENDEFVAARAVAETFGTDYKEIIIDDLFKDFPLRIWHYGSPKRNLWAFDTLKAIKGSNCDVALSGEGGDELFGGYTFRYDIMAKVSKSANYKERVTFYLNTQSRDWVPDQEKMFGERFKKNSKLLYNWDAVLPLFYPYFKSKLSIMGQTFLADYNFKLRCDFYDTDLKMAKAVGIDVASPFLSKKMVSFATHIPYRFKYHSRQSKMILRKLLKDLGAPDLVINKPKQGWSAGPVTVWRKGLKDRCEHFVLNGAIIEDGWIDKKWVEKTFSMIEEHINDKENQKIFSYINKLWDLLAFEIFYQQRIINDPASPRIQG